MRAECGQDKDQGGREESRDRKAGTIGGVWAEAGMPLWAFRVAS